MTDNRLIYSAFLRVAPARYWHWAMRLNVCTRVSFFLSVPKFLSHQKTSPVHLQLESNCSVVDEWFVSPWNKKGSKTRNNIQSKEKDLVAHQVDENHWLIAPANVVMNTQNLCERFSAGFLWSVYNPIEIVHTLMRRCLFMFMWRCMLVILYHVAAM